MIPFVTKSFWTGDYPGNIKPWWMSRQFWIGVFAVIHSVADYVSVQDWSDWERVNWAAFVGGLALVIMRWLTDKPITSVNPKLDKLRPHLMKRIKVNNAEKT